MFSQPEVSEEDAGLNISDLSQSEFQEAADGFCFVIKDVVRMAYNNVLTYFLWKQQEQDDDEADSKHAFPSIEVEITPQNDIEAMVSDEYRNNRYVRLFEILVRIKGIEYDEDAVLWS